MQIIDTSGLQCPAPLISTNRALKEAKAGETFKIITDNHTSFNNISRYLKDNKTDFSFDEQNGVWTIVITKKSGEPISPADPGEFCKAREIPHFSKGDFVIVFTSDKMGEGDAELGYLLISNFVKAIKDLDVLPGHLVFYNSGIKLGAQSSPVEKYLKELERMGVKLLFCATCAKFYSLEEKIGIGTMSNMFEIAQVMSSSGNILRP